MHAGRNGNRKRKGAVVRPRTVTSSGNVFADLNLPNPEIARAKAELVRRIREIISDRRLSQTRAAALMGLDQPKVSALVRGRVDGYSLDRLFRFLNALGQEIEICLRAAPASQKSGRRPGVLVR